MDRIDPSENLPMHSCDFELPYFIEGENFDQMIDLIQGESVHPIAKLGYESDLLDSVMSGGQVMPTAGNAFGYDHTSSVNCDLLSEDLSLRCFASTKCQLSHTSTRNYCFGATNLSEVMSISCSILCKKCRISSSIDSFHIDNLYISIVKLLQPPSVRPLLNNSSHKEMDRIDPSENLPMHSCDFELPYFIEGENFDQMIDLIQGESVHPVAKLGYESDLLDSVMSGGQVMPTAGNAFGYDHTSSINYDFVIDSLPSPGEDAKENLEDENDREDSSGTTTTTTTTATATTPTKRTKTDRSRTLISERRRRGRMKDKLYALRSLVPNITKMDKASIVGDAVLYVQELQTQAKKLKAEIASLEASWAGTGLKRHQAHNETPKRIQTANSDPPICRKILQTEVFQVEERGFYVRLVCHKGAGVAVSLYKALESLTSFHVQNSNLAATASERFVFTFTLNVKESEQDVTLPNLKPWITGALLNQGFEVKSPPSSAKSTSRLLPFLVLNS